MDKREKTGEQGDLLEGMKLPRTGKKRRQMVLAAGLLMKAGAGDPLQSEDSVARTLADLNRLHGELLRERTAPIEAPAAGGLLRRKILPVAASVAVVAVLAGLAVFLALGRAPRPDRVGTVSAVLGAVEVVNPEGHSSRVRGSSAEAVHERDTVMTDEGSQAVIALDDGGTVRLDLSSSIEFEGKSDEALEVCRLEGNTYHRVAAGTGYRVMLDNAEVLADGCAFNVDRKESSLAIVAVEGSIVIERGSARVTVEEGAEVLLSGLLAVASIQPREISPGALDTPWFFWNRDEDVSRGFDPGVLAYLEVPPQDTSPLQEPQAPPEPPPAPEPPPGDDPEQPVTPGSITLSVNVEPQQNVLGWSMQNAPGYQRLVVLRSKTNPEPSFPVDSYQEIDPVSTSYCDTGISGGETYYYRVAALAGEAVALYSNAVAAPVPTRGEVALSGHRDGENVSLAWTSQANFDNARYAVCRSSGGEPVFPPPAGQVAWLVYGPGGTFVDTGVTPGGTYLYRVVLLHGSQPVAYSNTLTVKVPVAE